MRYLGIARKKSDGVLMPDAFKDIAVETFEAVEIGGDILLTPTPLDRERLAQIEKLARLSIREHRASLEGLAR